MLCAHILLRGYIGTLSDFSAFYRSRKKIRWRPFFRRLNVVVYILEIYLVTDEIYLKSIIIGSRLDYSL